MNNPEYLTEFSKFLIFFKVDEDPELVELLCDQVCKRVKDFTIDEHLTILTNLAHTLNPAYEDVFQSVTSEFEERLAGDYITQNHELYLKQTDIIKIINTLVGFGRMTGELRHAIYDFIKVEMNSMNYETLAELAVVYATKMDKTYQGLFFNLMKNKFMNDLQYLKDETLYKILWAVISSGEM